MFWDRLAASSTRQKTAFLALLAAALGSLMPWFSSGFAGVTISRAGIDLTAGWVCLVAGLVGAAAVLVGTGSIRVAVDELLPALVAVAAAVTCLVIGIVKWDDSVTYGLLAVIAGGAVALLAAGLELRAALVIRAGRPRVIIPDPPAKSAALPPAPAALPPAAAGDRTGDRPTD
jgi:hypothetical protein